MTNRIALDTGAGSGIGKAVALASTREGHRVVLAGRNEQNLRQVGVEAVEAGGVCDVVPTDVGEPAPSTKPATTSR